LFSPFDRVEDGFGGNVLLNFGKFAVHPALCIELAGNCSGERSETGDVTFGNRKIWTSRAVIHRRESVWDSQSG